MFYSVLMYSCGDCVETGGTCGWCLYGELCSGIPDISCPILKNSLGANNSYLLVSVACQNVPMLECINCTHCALDKLHNCVTHVRAMYLCIIIPIHYNHYVKLIHNT